MNIATIDETLHAAKTLQKKFGSGSPQAFALNWIAWEQIKIRTVRVAAFHDGWNQSLVEKALREFANSRKGVDVDLILQQLVGNRPSKLTDSVGETWRAIEDFKRLRNLFIHGTSRTKPQVYEEASALINGLVHEPIWLAQMRLKGVDGKPELGNVMRNLGRGRQSVKKRPQELGALLQRLDPFGKMH